MSKLEEFMEKYNNINKIFQHSESDSGVYDISNKRRIGFTEV